MRSLYILVRDEQDSVRICGNASCVALASVLSPEDRATLILPLFLELAADSSWRVRFTTVTQIDAICALFPQELVEAKLLPEFLRLMQDPELEVRTGAAGAVNSVCRWLPVETIREKMMRAVEELSNDPSEHVRIALAGEFLSGGEGGVGRRSLRDAGRGADGEGDSPDLRAAAGGHEHEGAAERGVELRQDQGGDGGRER